MTKRSALAVIRLMKRRLDPTALLNKANKSLHPKVIKHPDFKVGDTIKVSIKVTEGEKVRVQAFEGLVIGKSRGSQGGRFVVRKISYGIGVERIFQSNSPIIEKITVISKGNVRRSKLYYLRQLSGRSARVKSDLLFGTEKEPSAAATQASDETDGVAKALQA